MAAADMRGDGRSYTGIEYSRPGGTSLQFDAEVPLGNGLFPAVIIVHGGGWVTGERRHRVQPLFQALTDAGFAWFSISYRLAGPGDPTTPALSSAVLLGGAIDDVRAAVSYVRAHAAEYRVDPNRIALVGESAGGQLAAMAALKPAPGGSVKAVVAMYAPMDLVALVETMPMIPVSIRDAVRGTSFEEMLTAHLRELSPVKWVHKDAPPFLMIHGTADKLIPFKQSVDFCSAMKSVGGSCELYPIERAGHGLRWWESGEVAREYKAAMVHFLGREMGVRR
jgi:alpha-L-fucosidase 2